MLRTFLLSTLMVGLLAACGGKKETTETAPAEAPKVAEAAPAEQVHPGKKVYSQYCVVCHMNDGKGIDKMYPPLIQTDWVLGDKEKLVKVVLNGLSGPIEINGNTYNNAMPAHNFLSDKEIADVLSYVRSSFGNDAPAITSEEVTAIRASNTAQ